MRAAIWVFIVLTALAGVAVFVPALELQAKGGAVGRSTSLSLYEAGSNRDYARRFIVAYHASGAKKIGPAVVAAMKPRVGGKIGSLLGDARDAMSTLDSVSASDAETLGTVLVATVYSFLALQVLVLGLLFGDAIDGAIRRRRIIAALAVAFVTTAVAVTIHVVESTVVDQANDEIGSTVLGLGAGAWLLPIAAGLAFLSGVAVLILRLRGERAGRAAPPTVTSVSVPAATPPTGAS